MKPLLCALAAALFLGGCMATQTTSGAAYLDRHSAVLADAAPPQAGPTGVTTQAHSLPYAALIGKTVSVDGAPAPSTDQLIATVAAIEPNLRFPARIGLARVIGGQLTTVPAQEAREWQRLADRYPAYGTFVPVSPISAAFVQASAQRSQECQTGSRASCLVSEVRLGAARQHLDMVLMYEVSARARRRPTQLAVFDITVIGGAILPTRGLEAEAGVTALLVDVVNGYPYGTANTQQDISRLSTSWGSRRRQEAMREEVSLAAVSALMPEIETMFAQLYDAYQQGQGRPVAQK